MLMSFVHKHATKKKKYILVSIPFITFIRDLYNQVSTREKLHVHFYKQTCIKHVSEHMHKELHVRNTTDTKPHQEIECSTGCERRVADWYCLVLAQLTRTL
jgi:hypothetical protein